MIYERADAEQPFMGLRTFSGDFPTKKDIGIAKNYLDEKELKERVSSYVSARKPEYMIPSFVVALDKMVYNDARKEFDLNSQTGFGVDGDRKQMEADFEEVRGNFESNSFVKAVLEHIERKTELGNKMLKILDTIQ